MNKEDEKQKILELIQALKDRRPWADEQIDYILDLKEEYEKKYNESLPWL